MAPGMKFPPNSELWMPLGQTSIGRVEGGHVRSFQPRHYKYLKTL
jgi:hypothetical protein